MNKRELSGPKRWIIEQCQAIGFGQITFYVRRGEPDLDKSWHTRQTVKLSGGANGPRPEASLADFELCREHVSLLETLAHLRDGTRVMVEVRHGLPFLIEIERNHQAA